jgi:hypothetical protein
MKIVTGHKASQMADSEPVESLSLVFDVEMPDPPLGGDNYAIYREILKSEGEAICEALYAHLPGGVIDQLLVALLIRKASLFRVTF